MSDIVSRRSAMLAGVGLATSTLASTLVGATDVPSKAFAMISKIDTHHHFLPRVYVDAIGLETLASVMPNRVAPQWSAALALQMMDANGISEGILSISSGPPIPDAADLLRRCNEAAAELRAAHPGRFGAFASLPLPDIEASLKEIVYSRDTLKADGFIVFTNYDGKYLGDPLFAPVLEELDRRGAVAFIHPNHPPYELSSLPPASVIEFPFDTTRTALSLMYSGALARYSQIKFILSHAGGTLPYLAGRIAGAVMMDPAVAERVGDPMTAMRAFYYDTALSASPSALAALMKVADSTRILFGTDFPMAPPVAIHSTSSGIEQAPLSEAVRADISRGAAVRLLGRA